MSLVLMLDLYSTCFGGHDQNVPPKELKPIAFLNIYNDDFFLSREVNLCNLQFFILVLQNRKYLLNQIKRVVFSFSSNKTRNLLP